MVELIGFLTQFIKAGSGTEQCLYHGVPTKLVGLESTLNSIKDSLSAFPFSRITRVVELSAHLLTRIIKNPLRRDLVKHFDK